MNPVSRGDSRRLATEAPYNVDDYETWRKVYDQFYGERGAMGVMGAAAFQSVDDPNELTVWQDFETSEVARAFVSSKRSPERRAACRRPGRAPVLVRH
jgi:hypothetical protein